MDPVLALAQAIGAAVGGAVGSVAAIRIMVRRIAREEGESAVRRMVKPEARKPHQPQNELEVITRS